ncbi:GDSL-type esterase/lipase family protein [Sphaerobacter sp.]|uniref:GDSL-type esterase/lipase family protein n=1 Tax=Sphaerobacter sp. TaxID=2099654 RepID=UPI001D73ABEA|nr:GDSL-type esterase/lipase family protein [Sphaerobacter sp.]MBX5445146.1 hypothetical protein [Sphaerobacter sp.]
MSRARSAVVVALLITTALAPLASGTTRRVAAQPALPEQVYLALGDSIAAGLVTTLPRLRGYPWLVRDLMEKQFGGEGAPAVTLINRAVPGETTESFLTGDQLRLARADIEAAHARGAQIRAVTLTLGGNDILRLAGSDDAARQAGLERFRTTFPAALAAIREALGETAADIAVTTYYDLSEGDPAEQGSDAWWVAQFNEVIRQSAAAEGARVADVEPVFRGHIREWTWYPTDVHANNAGHAEIARLVWQALGYDQEAPTVTIERPATGPLGRRTPTVRVRADDAVGVTRVELLVDGEYVQDLHYVPSQSAYLGVWDARDWTGASATLTVRATDLAGNQASADVEVALPGS